MTAILDVVDAMVEIENASTELVALDPNFRAYDFVPPNVPTEGFPFSFSFPPQGIPIDFAIPRARGEQVPIEQLKPFQKWSDDIERVFAIAPYANNFSRLVRATVPWIKPVYKLYIGSYSLHALVTNVTFGKYTMAPITIEDTDIWALVVPISVHYREQNAVSP